MPPLSSLLAQPPEGMSYHLGYSGGLDSTVLLHLARAAELPGLRAVHVHHGLQAEADRWAAHCETQARTLGVPIDIARVQIDAQHPKGPEAAAREARYAALREHVPAGGVLLTAHHQRDQAETVLLRLLRGTGVQGLAAMAMTSLAAPDLVLWRPLLQMPQATLASYAREQGLQYLDDPHNRDARYARSHLRHHIMPLLRARWPQADAELARAAAHAADAAGLLDGVARRLLVDVRDDDGSLKVDALLALAPAERRLVLRHWLTALGLPLPSAAQMQQLEERVLLADAEAQPLLCWPGVECRRYRRALHASAPLPDVAAGFETAWDGERPLALPEGYGSLAAPAGLPGGVQVRFARGGERLRPAGDRHTSSYKYLMQSHGLAPWLRPRLPLVFVQERLVSIAGRIQSDGAPQLAWNAPGWPGLPLSWRCQ